MNSVLQTSAKPPPPSPLPLRPPPQTHPSTLFPQITKCRTLAELKQVHAHMIKSAQIHDPLAAAELLRYLSLSPHRDLAYAVSFFRLIPRPNCISWNTIIRALSESGDDNDDPVRAIALFVEMVCDESVEPNQFTFPSVLKACARSGLFEEGRQVHCLAVKKSLDCDEFVVSNLVRMYVLCRAMVDAHRIFDMRVIKNHSLNEFTKRRREGDVVLWNVMVDGYVRAGNFAAARKLFDEMPHRSVVSWNVMISGYAQNGLFKEAIEAFHEMQQIGEGELGPNYITLVSILPAISRLGALELGKWVHLYAERNGIEIDDVLGSALVDMYSKCGSIEKAVQVFERLPRRNPITWNSIIGGLAMHGRAEDALNYFWEMEKFKVTATDVAYISVLTACSHAGLLSEGRSVFHHMVNVARLEPRIEHYTCMVDLLGRAGHLDEAEQLITNMLLEPDDVILKALLAACKLHGNIEMGERIAKRLMELAPTDSGPYVVLSNMFASVENWEAVSEVRLTMKEMDITKDPGCSWIEIDGIIHEFVVEDGLHPQAREIHSMLEEISDKLRLLGYRPNTSQVLLNVGEQEKEIALHYHSEKIAIAFGLISTGPGSPLRVAKNLRICEDCHESMKLISKAYNRKIVVRDRRRFHHFEDGSCSCGGYW
ncbi:hypothetical protein CDL15_Pgr020089 [Punica granatum]|uniref:DYW domain-containing protein n=1 Tax=Punica granatum TaxID=22663 RepID=A0A218VQL9_PUNGR|nr:hypothetical protein CDL15_Pgr020089 [Punica granatum]PKI76799.1 hypothetical protein CRG98_002785 [Punica granatum]